MFGLKHIKTFQLKTSACGIGLLHSPHDTMSSWSLRPLRSLLRPINSMTLEAHFRTLARCAQDKSSLSPLPPVLCDTFLKWSRRTAAGSYWGGSKVRPTEWNKAVSEAEKIVGYSTSFLSLRCLLSDEMSNVAMHMKKLVGTGHPLLKTARKLFYNDQHSMQTRGLLVLLISKAAGQSPEESKFGEIMTSGIYPSQRTLAEITEMIHTAGLIHKGLVNVETESLSGDALKDMELGNKMAVLSGDFLLANASTGLAALNNTKVVELISSAIGDMAKAEFTKFRDRNGNCILPADGASIGDWQKQTYLSSGSLIAKSCQAALLLADHPKPLQDHVFEFGKQIAFAHKVNQELQPIISSHDDGNFDLTITSLPAILYIKDYCQDDHAQIHLTGEPVSTKKLLEILRPNKAVILESRHLCNEFGQKALKSLSFFENSEAKDALKNIVKAVTTV